MPLGAHHRASVSLPDETALSELLDQTAAEGLDFQSEWGRGPWAWLHQEVVLFDWIASALPGVFRQLIRANTARVYPVLDFLCIRWDSWRYRGLLAELEEHAAPLLDAPARERPAFWPLGVRGPNVGTLREVVDWLDKEAKAQLDTPPVLDLDPLY